MFQWNWIRSLARPPIIGLTFFLIFSMTANPAAHGQCSDGKVQASNSLVDYTFGTTVDISGDRAIVGKPQQSQPDSKVFVYRFESASSSWMVEAQLVPNDPMPGSGFGYPVVLSGDVAAVGASYDDEQGVNTGAVYIFRYHPDRSVWIQEEKLFASDGNGQDYFGTAISLSNNVLVVGAASFQLVGAGHVYFFRFDEDHSVWTEEQIVSPPPGLYSYFGYVVAAKDQVSLITAYKDNGYDPAIEHVLVYRFEALSNSWLHEAVLSITEQDVFFGVSTAIDGDIAVIGSAKPIGSPQGVALAAHVFRFDRLSNQWNEEAQLDASNTPTNFLWIAKWLAIDGDTIAFGDIWDNNNGTQTGSVFLHQYHPDSTKWVKQGKLIAPDGAVANNDFGFAVALENGRVVAGAPVYPQTQPSPGPGSAYFFVLAGDDCNANGVCDRQDIASGASLDTNSNGVPDECELVAGDIDGDGLVNVHDLLLMIMQWGPCPTLPQQCPADLNGDGTVYYDDLLIVLGNWSS